MNYSDAKRLFDVMSDEMARLGGLLYGLKKDGVLVDSMSVRDIYCKSIIWIT